MPEDVKRFTAARRRISDINIESDIRVRLIGMVVDKDGDSVVLDDGSGNIRLVGNIASLENGKTYRIIGKVMPTPDGLEMNAEIVHDFAVDQSLHRKVEELERAFGGEYFV
jgi:hypothetical protein